ncbi:MAG: tRNA1(Val) (adenine(37)-N6)-methyltransferase [Clostridium sp.]
MLKPGEKIEDLDLKGLKIIQNKDWFCFGIDAVLLADFANAKHSSKVVDFGTGTGIIPLLMEGRYEPTEIVGVEVQEEVAEMASRSIELNSLSHKIRIINEDIKNYKAIGTGCYDVVVCNPPYKKNNTGLLNPTDKKAISRHEILITLDDIILSASKVLQSGGKLYMIHRPERLEHIILSLNKHKFAPRRLRFVHPKEGKSPTMLLIEAVRSGGDFLTIDSPLYVYNLDGSYTEEINKIYGRC